MNILIMGGPGAGKGTMSAKIVEQYNVNHISTGDIFREEISSGSALGQEAKTYIDQGLLVPDEITNAMVKDYLEHLPDLKSGYLLDGYPRTLDQAKAFDALSKDSAMAVDVVIAMEIPFAALAERISGRRLCKSCGAIYHIHANPSKQEGVCDVCGSALYQRKDDTVESLQVRLQEYTRQTQPVLDFYEAKGLVKHINADQPIEAVWASVVGALKD